MIIWEITIFLCFFAGDDPQNPEICKSQREITIFLLFWSGKSLFSSKPGNLQITTGDHDFLAFLEWEITIFLFFWRRRPSKPGNLQITTGDHDFLAFLEWEITIFLFFWRRRPSKPGNLQITTGDHDFLAFLQWEITIFLCFFAGDDPQNPEICKSQREITIFLLFWSGKSLFSCFFWRRRPSKPGNLQITTGDHYFLAFLEWEIPIFLFFLEATTLETRKSANHNGRSLFSCFFGADNRYFFLFLAGDNLRNPQICKSQREISIFLFFLEATTLETRKSANHSGRSLCSCFFGCCRLQKSQENRDFLLQKSKKIVISRCDLQISGFRGSSPPKKTRK